MPLIKREVEPVLVSRVDIGREIQNELECVTNYTLSSIIRQLSNLGKHAEDIFGELYREAMQLSGRANTLQDRIEKLSDKVTKLDATRDQVSLQDIHMRKAFKSSLALETEVVSSPTMPSAMRETYMRCEKPPKLSLLNQFREDGKDGLKFYTDPKFFFERWCNEQRKDIENNIRKRKKRRQKKPAAEKGSMPKVPVNTRKNRYQMYAGGAEFAQQQKPQQNIPNSHISSNQMNQDPKHRISHSDSIISSTPSDDSGINGQSLRRKPSQGPPPPPVQPGGESPMNGDVVLRPVRPAPARPPSQQQQPISNHHHHHSPSMPPPPPPDVPQPQSYLSSGTSGYSSASDQLPPPPPPPQPIMMNNHVPTQPPPPPVSAQQQPLPNNIPPPPPPPPVGGPAPPPPPPIGGMQIQKPPVANNNVPAPPPPPPDQFRLPSAQPAPASNPNNTSPVVNSPNKPPPVQASDPRSDLLAAIKEGMKLRKVEVQEEKQRHSEPAPNSVEAILRRRIAVELSSDEEDSQISSDYEGEWSDDD